MLSKDAGTSTKCHKNIFLAIIPEQNKDILGRRPFKNEFYSKPGIPVLFQWNEFCHSLPTAVRTLHTVRSSLQRVKSHGVTTLPHIYIIFPHIALTEASHLLPASLFPACSSTVSTQIICKGKIISTSFSVVF